ncbi:L-serine ammonia-lyase [Bifidobacterium aemilianum]|uniref:L-serine dehydratase n=1 Tax=Bifidobacterium aemilianum TaxID=2493120 RepID=A0A366KAH5_9BIFI|nr:L-serine ammonia-lyase [Bifidobacterium aemilianum]RBP98113.1 L-serine ammonia-lyase [Bifidobacterium aemilianum]
MFSILDMFTVGVGPSSSHTVGPMCAAKAFVDALDRSGVLGQVSRVQVILYGSLSLTGMGHGTDRAAVAGLEGNTPEQVDTDHLLNIRSEVESSGRLVLGGRREIAFDYGRDVVFEQWQMLAEHPNGMRFTAWSASGQTVDEQVWYSIGGGFVRQGHVDDPLIGIHENPSHDEQPATDEVEGVDFAPEAPYHFSSADELLALCEHHQMGISEIIWANETSIRSAEEVRQGLLEIWGVMDQCVREGCTSKQEILPGGLDVRRRAPDIYRRLTVGSDPMQADLHMAKSALEDSAVAWVNLFALAVSEQNAGGGRVVTAPTNGAAGIMPAVLEYYWRFVPAADEDGIVCFLLTSGAIGYLLKRNASISGAEVGCQGEVGSACSMAAAGLCAAMGGTPRQVENAAEIGMEHHLGLTCDPVGGLVQVPCIERNAMASNTAINAVRMALLGDGSHLVTLDQVIRTMKETGQDMMSKYKETSKGGLAVNVVEC